MNELDPGHQGIDGNEKEEKLVRKGSQSSYCGPEPVIGFTTLGPEICD